MIAPALDESAESFAGRLDIAKINVDENQSVPSRYHVRGIPTLMLFQERRGGRHKNRRRIQIAS